MSSAHRPTFDHARGKEKKVSSSITHKRALPSHSKLKFRTKKARKNEEFLDQTEEKACKPHELDKLERLEPDGTDTYSHTTEQEEEDNMTEETTTGINFGEEKNKSEVAEKNEDTNGQGKKEPPMDSSSQLESEVDGESASESESDSDEDEEEALLREMELIRKEREEAKKKAEEEKIEHRAKVSNPLLRLEEPVENNSQTQEQKPQKKSWRNVKTMSRKPNMNETDRFSNDTLKSDFHKDFLDRYIR